MTMISPITQFVSDLHFVMGYYKGKPGCLVCVW